MTPTHVPHPDAIAERLGRAASARGQHPKPVVLSAVATHSLFFGADADLRTRIVTDLGSLAQTDPARFLTTYRALWEATATTFPYLREHLGPVVGWLDHASPESVTALGDALVESARMDLHAAAEQPTVQGDLLGQVLMAVDAPGDRQARGAFYTPPSLATLLARLTEPENFETFTDPCCGGGGLAIATIREMRRAGRAPETVQWALNDLDPTAVVCAGVAMASHGMPHVTLTCGDTLAPQAPRP